MTDIAKVDTKKAQDIQTPVIQQQQKETPKQEGSVFAENPQSETPMPLPNMPVFDYGPTASPVNQIPIGVSTDKTGATSAQYACDGHDTLTEISNVGNTVAKATAETAKKISEVVVDSAKSATTFVLDMGEYYSEQYEGVSSYSEFVERTDAMLSEGFQIIDDHTVNPLYEKAKQTCKDNEWTTAEACVELAQETINSKSITTGAIVTAATITGVSAVAAAVPTVAGYGIGLATTAGMVYGAKNTAEGVGDAVDAKTAEEYKAGVKKALSGEVMALLSTFGFTQMQEASAASNNPFLNDRPCSISTKPSINEVSTKPATITVPRLAQTQLVTSSGAIIHKTVIIPAQVEVLSLEKVETLATVGQQIAASASPVLAGVTASTAVANAEPEKPTGEETRKKTEEKVTEPKDKKEVVDTKLDSETIEKGTDVLAKRGTPEHDAISKITEETFVRIKDKQTAMEIYRKQFETLNLGENDNVYVLTPKTQAEISTAKTGTSYSYSSQWYAEANGLSDRVINADTLKQLVAQNPNQDLVLIVPDDVSITGRSLFIDTVKSLETLDPTFSAKTKVVPSPMVISDTAQNLFASYSQQDLTTLIQSKSFNSRDVEMLKTTLLKLKNNVDFVMPQNCIQAKSFYESSTYKALLEADPGLAQKVSEILTQNGRMTGFGKPGTSGLMVATPTEDGISLKTPNNNAYGATPYAIESGANPERVKRLNSNVTVKDWIRRMKDMKNLLFLFQGQQAQ